MKKFFLLSALAGAITLLFSQQAIHWGHSFSGNYFDVPYSIIASEHYLWLTGWTSSEILYYDSDSLTIGATSDQLFLLRTTLDGTNAKARTLGGNLREVGRILLPVNDKTVFLAGYFQSDSMLVDNFVLHNKGGKDAFMMKMDSAFQVQWVRIFQGDWDDDLRIIKEHNGLIYGVVTFMGTNLFLPNGDTVQNVSPGTNDVLLFSMDTSGNMLAYALIHGSNHDVISDLWVDEQNVYLIGFTQSDTLFVDTVSLIKNNAAYAGVTIALTHQLMPVWGKIWGGNGNDYGWKIIVDNNNVYFAGTFSGNDVLVDNLSLQNHSLGYYDIVIGSMDKSNGSIGWLKCAGGDDDDDVYALDFFKNDFIIIGGSTLSEDFQIDSFRFAGDGSSNTLLLILDLSGQTRYASSVNYPGSENIWAITTNENYVYLAGTFTSPVYTFYDKTFFNEGDMSSDIFIVLMTPFLVSYPEYQSNDIFIYPNPASENIFIQINKVPFDLEIYDLQGKVVFTKYEELKTMIKIPVEGWKKGMYLMKFKTSTTTYYKKIIING